MHCPKPAPAAVSISIFVCNIVIFDAQILCFFLAGGCDATGAPGPRPRSWYTHRSNLDRSYRSWEPLISFLFFGTLPKHNMDCWGAFFASWSPGSRWSLVALSRVGARPSSGRKCQFPVQNAGASDFFCARLISPRPVPLMSHPIS